MARTERSFSWFSAVSLLVVVIAVVVMGPGAMAGSSSGPGIGASGGTSERAGVYQGFVVTTAVPPVCPVPVGVGSVCFEVPPEWEKSGGGVHVAFRDATGLEVGGLVEVRGGIIFSERFCGEWDGAVWPASELHVYVDPAGCGEGGFGTVGTVTATFFAPPPGSEPPQ